MTLILTRRDVAALLDIDACIAAVREAFRLDADGRTMPARVLGVHAAEGGFHFKAAGLVRGRTWFAGKLNANFPANPARFGLPTIQGVIALCDGGNGALLALMDSIEITALRTAAATAVAAEHLARPDSRVVTICGCGSQGRSQLRALRAVRSIERVWAFDSDAERSQRFAREMAEPALDVRGAASLGEAARASDICVTCTPSHRPILGPADVSPGTFVAAVGADSDDKQELAPALMAAGTVVVDVLDQCAAIGDLHHALDAGAMTREDVYAELGELVAGRKPGRRSADEITIFDSTGTALEDVAAAVLVYEKAVGAGRGIAIALGE